jgi:hypothetical protein
MVLMPQKAQDAQRAVRQGRSKRLKMVPPSLLVYVISRMARMSAPLRASNEGLLRPRVARAQGTHRAIPLLLADFFSILLEAEPDAKQGVLGAEIQREFLPVVVGREIFVLAEQKHLFSQIALQSAKELIAQRP